jgi:predicted site-specific integrase-resolvase
MMNKPRRGIMQKPYNTKEAADYLGMKPSTLEAWRCRGGGPIFLKFGKAVRYRPEDLEAFMDERRRANTSDQR